VLRELYRGTRTSIGFIRNDHCRNREAVVRQVSLCRSSRPMHIISVGNLFHVHNDAANECNSVIRRMRRSAPESAIWRLDHMPSDTRQDRLDSRTYIMEMLPLTKHGFKLDADRCAWPRSDATTRQFRFDTQKTDRACDSIGRGHGIPGRASSAQLYHFT